MSVFFPIRTRLRGCSIIRDIFVHMPTLICNEKRLVTLSHNWHAYNKCMNNVKIAGDLYATMTAFTGLCLVYDIIISSYKYEMSQKR